MLNEKQQKALKKLEKAFKECSEAKIYFYGYDTDLNWSLKTEFEMNGSFQEWSNKAADGELVGLVDTCNSYMGSGGM
jgi:hypothetical protein